MDGSFGWQFKQTDAFLVILPPPGLARFPAKSLDSLFGLFGRGWLIRNAFDSAGGLEMSIGFENAMSKQKTERPPLLAAFAFIKRPSRLPATQEQHAQTAQCAQGQRRGFRHRRDSKLDGWIVHISFETDQIAEIRPKLADADRAI